MNDKTNTYFKNLRKATTEGQAIALRAWVETTRSESSVFEVRDLPWEQGIHDFVKTIRAAGVTEFAITSRTCTLIACLHRLVEEGCTMQGLCKVTRNEGHWDEENNHEFEGILFRT